MNTISRKIFLGSLGSLAALTSTLTFAEEMVTAPSFEGGVTASIGTFYAVPSADDTAYLVFDESSNNFKELDIFNAQAGYNFGWQGSLGYLFEDTANGIELFYRGYNGDDTTDPKTGNTLIGTLDNVQDSVSYELNAIDLMISQYLDIGTHMQMRFSGGISYAEIEQEQTITGSAIDGRTTNTLYTNEKSTFQGLGPRLAMDGRYDFGEEIAGFGIVGGASVAFYLGDTDLTLNLIQTSIDNGVEADQKLDTNETDITDNLNNHAVTNLRANLGIDYVYFFDNEDRSTLGIELGYLVDYYDDAISSFSTLTGSLGEVSANLKGTSASVTSQALTFSGPYVEIKGVF